MGCIALLLALISPRLALVFLWLFTGVLGRAFEGWLLPLLGFVLLPWTTLAYAGMWELEPRGIQGLEWLLLVVALLADLGSYAGGGRGRR